MQRALLAFSVLVIAAFGWWAWALTAGPDVEGFVPAADWPEPLEPWQPAVHTGVLAGRIEAADGAPVALALVQVAGDDGLFWTRTSALGRFELDALPALEGPALATVLAYEHLPQRFEFSADARDVVWRLDPPPGEVEALPELVTRDFVGRVERAEGAPAGFEVWITPPPGTDLLTGQVERRAVVAADGTYSFVNLAAGVYQAQLLPPWARGGTWPIVGTGAIAVESSQALAQPPPIAVREGGLAGVVRDADGEPLVGAMVIVQAADDPNRLCPPQATDAEGGFALDALPAGRFVVDIVSGAHRVTRELDVALGATTQADVQLEAPAD